MPAVAAGLTPTAAPTNITLVAPCSSHLPFSIRYKLLLLLLASLWLSPAPPYLPPEPLRRYMLVLLSNQGVPSVGRIISCVPPGV